MVRATIATLAALLALGPLGCADRALSGADTDPDPDDEDDGDPPEMHYDPGDRPKAPGSMYSVCADSSVCAPLEFCVFPADEAGFCSDACAGVDDPSPCDAAPDGEARAFCLDIGLPDARRVCAIDCEEGRSCPRGMRCEGVLSAGEARNVCF